MRCYEQIRVKKLLCTEVARSKSKKIVSLVSSSIFSSLPIWIDCG